MDLLSAYIDFNIAVSEYQTSKVTKAGLVSNFRSIMTRAHMSELTSEEIAELGFTIDNFIHEIGAE